MNFDEEDITQEIEVARRHLFAALGSICVISGYILNSPAISNHIKEALAMLPKQSADNV